MGTYIHTSRARVGHMGDNRQALAPSRWVRYDPAQVPRMTLSEEAPDDMLRQTETGFCVP